MGNLNCCARRTSKIYVVKLQKGIKTPTRATRKAAGLDIYSPVDFIVPAHDKRRVATGLAVQVPEGCYGRISSKSGPAHKNNLHVGAGVVDSDFQGEVYVLLYNLGALPQPIKKGRAIAQLICERIDTPRVVLVNHFGEISERGTHGWGSGIQVKRQTWV